MRTNVSRRELLHGGMAGCCGAIAATSAVVHTLGTPHGDGPNQHAPPAGTAQNHEGGDLCRPTQVTTSAIGPSTILYGFRDALLIKLTADSGVIGWGETADVGASGGIIENHLKRILLGADANDSRKLWRSLWGADRRWRAVAGVDIALHDLRGKALNLSIADM